MVDIEIYSVLVTRIEYGDKSGSKIRPAVVVKFNDEVIRTFRITSKYENNSDDEFRSAIFRLRIRIDNLEKTILEG